MNGRYFFNFEKIAYLKGKKPEGCILCLLRDRDPAVADLRIYEDELFLASVNLYPYNPGHLLVFPCRHIEDVRSFSREEEDRLPRLLRYFLDVSDRLNKPSGYNIGYNMGLAAGASILHLHLHIIPRYNHEIGIADLIAGKRVLVEDPRETARRFLQVIAQEPFSMSRS